MTKQWNITLDGIEHTVIYQGMDSSGNLNVGIDNLYSKYTPSIVKHVGLFAELNVGGKEIVLKVSEDGENVELLIDNISVDADSSKIDITSNDSMEDAFEIENLQKKMNNKNGSFLMLVALTYLNLALILLNADINFPFSAIFPQIALIFGREFYIESGGQIAFYIVGIVFSVLFASVYLILYLLSKKSIVPVWIALISVVLDTIVLLWLSAGDFGSMIIDIAFHAWIIWALADLINVKGKLEKIKTRRTEGDV